MWLRRFRAALRRVAADLGQSKQPEGSGGTGDVFGSILIANRGEIACRVMRTARRLGLETIAVYSDADAGARHVREADRAVRLGPAPAADSYLRIDAVLAAARDTGAQAIHPGYGFLSENPDFAEACAAAGVTFVGPPPAVIRAMGLKDEAKRIARAAGVAVVPGYDGADQDGKTLLRQARAIGFPVLIKAVAGGGGRGIRAVATADAFGEALAAARREAHASFGDDRVLIEKLIRRPRHIEVQVFGDVHGNIIHLFERDCSVQRRRQKVIEEAPAPGMSEDVRTAMTHAAITAARAVGYVNAGTVEFIADGSQALRPDGFFFLEMNTRLQVEHPVTEAVTGLDLVELQLRVAAGEALPRQDAIRVRGAAVEARLCAEDPAEEHRPCTGQIARLDPQWTDVRIDSGVASGDAITPYYDSMIAKVIAHGADRALALNRLAGALCAHPVLGVATNAGLLARIARDPDFAAGAVDTDFLAERPHLVEAPAALTGARAFGYGALAVQALREARAAAAVDPWSAADGWRLHGPARLDFAFAADDRTLVVPVISDPGGLAATSQGAPQRLTRGEISLIGDGEPAILTLATPEGCLTAFADSEGVTLALDGFVRTMRYARADALVDALESGDSVTTPMPGKLVSLRAQKGASVAKGEILGALEAMKMEHALKSPRDGVVDAVLFRVGDQISEGAVVIRLAALEAAP